MTGIYFSGTGNTKHCIEQFMAVYRKLSDNLSVNGNTPAEESAILPTESAISSEHTILSIEDAARAAQALMNAHDIIILAYPVYYSNLPKIMRDFITTNRDHWKNKKVYILCTMGLFSGDGAGVSARLLRQYGATVIGGLHVQMPDCICDVKVLKYSPAQNHRMIERANQKLEKAAQRLAEGNPAKEGLNIFYHLAGLFGQRLWFYNKTLHYSDKLKINADACVKCGRCVTVCPMRNLTLSRDRITAAGQCTMCYRCVNQCPQKAITLIGKKVVASLYTNPR